jgi:hypothetical protein
LQGSSPQRERVRAVDGDDVRDGEQLRDEERDEPAGHQPVRVDHVRAEAAAGAEGRPQERAEEERDLDGAGGPRLQVRQHRAVGERLEAAREVGEALDPQAVDLLLPLPRRHARRDDQHVEGLLEAERKIEDELRGPVVADRGQRRREDEDARFAHPDAVNA